MKKSIAIDLDSVLNRLDDVWYARYNELYDDNLQPNDIKSWDIHNFVKPECGRKIYDILLEPYLFRGLPVMEGAIDALTYLTQHYDVYIVSSAHPATCADKAGWLAEHFPMIDQGNIIFCHPKHLINTDYLVDDGPHNIEGFKQEAIIFDQPWNQHINGFVRFYNWDQITRFFELLLKEEEAS